MENKVKEDYKDQLREQKLILKNHSLNYENTRDKFYRNREDVWLDYFDSILENQSYHLRNTVFDRLFLDTSNNLEYTPIVVNVGKEEYEIGTIKLDREVMVNDEGYKKYLGIGIDTYSTLRINQVETDKFQVLGTLSRLIRNIEQSVLERLNKDEKEYIDSMKDLNDEIRTSQTWIRTLESRLIKMEELKFIEDLEQGIKFKVNKDSDVLPLPRVGVRKNKDLDMVKELKILGYSKSGKSIKLKVKQTLPTGEYQQIWNRVNIEHFLSEMINRHTRKTHKYEVK